MAESWPLGLMNGFNVSKSQSACSFISFIWLSFGFHVNTATHGQTYLTYNRLHSPATQIAFSVSFFAISFPGQFSLPPTAGAPFYQDPFYLIGIEPNWSRVTVAWNFFRPSFHLLILSSCEYRSVRNTDTYFSESQCVALPSHNRLASSSQWRQFYKRILKSDSF